jgi:DNA-binding NtrC family response regulator
MEVAHQSGALNDAGLAALTMLEELSGNLEIDEMQTVYERAYCWLTPSQHLPTLHRLLHTASRVLSVGRKKKPATAAELEIIANVGTVTLDEMMRRFENNIIRQALIASQGSITRAALLLGVSHQRLGYILESKHRDLQSFRTPIRTRPTNIKKKLT